MAAVFTIEKTYSLGQTDNLYVGTIALDSSYPTGGETIDVTGNEQFDSMVLGHKSGYTFSFVPSSQKLIAYYVDNNGASDSAQIEVPDTTDLSAVTGITAWAIGQ